MKSWKVGTMVVCGVWDGVRKDLCTIPIYNRDLEIRDDSLRLENREEIFFVG